MKKRTLVVKLSVVAVILSAMVLAGSASAAIPLITDDTGTQGTGKFQLELSGEYGHDKEGPVTAKNSQLAATLTYGLTTPLDIVLSIPYQAWRQDDSDDTARDDGLGDLAIEAKWRFYEKEGWGLALKPGLTIPTGDEDRGLGAGRMTYYLYLIVSREVTPWAFHINLAYIRNDNKIDERKDLWHASLAATIEVMKNMKLVGDAGVETHPDRISPNPPVYILGGVIYSPGENWDIGLGVKGGLTDTETDIAVRGGITFRF